MKTIRRLAGLGILFGILIILPTAATKGNLFDVLLLAGIATLDVCILWLNETQ